MEAEDNPYRIPDLLPDEFHELFSDYENSYAWRHKEMDARQKALAERVLAKLRQADTAHICLDEMDGFDVSNEFPMTSITRADLVSAGFSEAVVASLTDSDMQHIASAMEDIYCDTGFWEDLQICTRRTLEHREEQAVLEQNE